MPKLLIEFSEYNNTEVVYIYGLIDPITDEIRYVGKSVHFKNRYDRHLKDAFKLNSYKDRWLRTLLSKGLKPNYIALDVVHSDEWEFWEIYWIALLKSWGCKLTNIAKGGGAKPNKKGYFKHSKETLIKMSNNAKGNKNCVGIKKTEAQKRRMSEIKKGVKTGKRKTPRSKEHVQKLIEVQQIPILQMDLNGNFIKEWSSQTEIRRILNIKHVGSCCKGKYKTAGGFTWKYKNENLNRKPKKKVTQKQLIEMSERAKKPVLQYDLDGNFIKEWKSAKDASESFLNEKIDSVRAGIGNCCRNRKHLHAYGYQWRHKNVEIEIKISSIYKEILQYNKNGELVGRYKNISEAIKLTNVEGYKIRWVLAGTRISSAGFVWKYNTNGSDEFKNIIKV